MNFLITATMLAVLLFVVVSASVGRNAMTNGSNSNSTTSNHYKYCEKLKDKKIRSIICPDLYSRKETTINLYG